MMKALWCFQREGTAFRNYYSGLHVYILIGLPVALLGQKYTGAYEKGDIGVS